MIFSSLRMLNSMDARELNMEHASVSMIFHTICKYPLWMPYKRWVAFWNISQCPICWTVHCQTRYFSHCLLSLPPTSLMKLMMLTLIPPLEMHEGCQQAGSGIQPGLVCSLAFILQDYSHSSVQTVVWILLNNIILMKILMQTAAPLE